MMTLGISVSNSEVEFARRFEKQFALKEPEREAIAWAWASPQETGDTVYISGWAENG